MLFHRHAPLSKNKNLLSPICVKSSSGSVLFLDLFRFGDLKDQTTFVPMKFAPFLHHPPPGCTKHAWKVPPFDEPHPRPVDTPIFSLFPRRLATLSGFPFPSPIGNISFWSTPFLAFPSPSDQNPFLYSPSIRSNPVPLFDLPASPTDSIDYPFLGFVICMHVWFFFCYGVCFGPSLVSLDVCFLWMWFP